MQKSIIGWTNQTWNPTFSCSKVSDGCKYCYAETLALKYGHSKSKWTIQNETENVQMKPHKLAEPYALKEPTRIFVNSMSDLFHRVIPDWYRAAVFCVMLSTPQHVYQVLTKRPEAAEDWHERFVAALQSPEFREMAAAAKNKRLKEALNTKWDSPWADHIWMGASIEDARVTHRLDSLRRNKAHVRFVSAEPLLGAWGQVDLSGIDWVIVGGESGLHLTGPEHPRWMQQAWAREIRDLCVTAGVAYFYKQDSGKRTELRPYLVEEDGTHTVWQQYPGDLKPPTVYETGELYVMPGKPTDDIPDTDWGSAPHPVEIRDVYANMSETDYVLMLLEEAGINLIRKVEVTEVDKRDPLFLCGYRVYMPHQPTNMLHEKISSTIFQWSIYNNDEYLVISAWRQPPSYVANNPHIPGYKERIAQHETLLRLTAAPSYEPFPIGTRAMHKWHGIVEVIDPNVDGLVKVRKVGDDGQVQGDGWTCPFYFLNEHFKLPEPPTPDPEPPTPPAPKPEAYEWFTVGDRAVRKADGAEFVVTATDGDFISGNRWYAEEKVRLVAFNDHQRSVKESYKVARLETIDRVHRKHFRRPEGEWSTTTTKPAEVITVITPAPLAQPPTGDVVVPDGAMAISLWEPYGTLIKVGAKQYETRHWRTGYRGPLVICTAKKRDREILESYKALRPDFFRYGVKMEPCRFGVALCLVDLVDCIPAEFIGDDERRFGNFAPGRFAWLLENVRPFAEPIPVRGHQGLWRWEDPRVVPADAVIPPGIEAPALSPRRVETMPTEEVEPVQLALL